MITIKVTGLKETIERMGQFPSQARRAIRTTMQAEILHIWESVPGYPPQPPTDYVRTGTLGRSIGSGTSGGMTGKPDIYEVVENGGMVKGSIGSSLDYAQYVIGDYAEQQAGHMRHWWTLPQDVLGQAFDGIKERFEILRDNLIAFLDKRGTM